MNSKSLKSKKKNIYIDFSSGISLDFMLMQVFDVTVQTTCEIYQRL